MKLVDVNILLYVVNQDSPPHATIRPWWENALKDEDPVGLAWVVVLGFLRISTNALAFPCPLAPDAAMAKINQWLSHPNIRLVKESDEHWRTLRSLLIETGTAGNLTTDAHLAALAISLGAELVSCDRDFARFPKLRWRNPLD